MNLNKLLTILKANPYFLTQAQALDLLALLLNFDRNQLWNHLDCAYWGSLRQLKANLELIAKGFPVSYILGKKHFLGTEFYIDERVLIPRDETESLVDLALKWLENFPKARIIDLGTGSGVIGLSLKKRFPQSQIWMSDSSWPALQVAQKNAQLHHLDVSFLLGDFLEPIENLAIKVNLIVTNPPYVADSSVLPHSLSFEPQQALIAPQQGLYFYQKLFANWKTIVALDHPCAIIMEFGCNQKSQLEALLQQYEILQSFSARFYRDWNYHWRYLVLEMRPNVKQIPNSAPR